MGELKPGHIYYERQQTELKHKEHMDKLICEIICFFAEEWTDPSDTMRRAAVEMLEQKLCGITFTDEYNESHRHAHKYLMDEFEKLIREAKTIGGALDALIDLQRWYEDN
jgi:hypothetical protein